MGEQVFLFAQYTGVLLHALRALSLVVLPHVPGLKFGRISDGHLCSPLVPLQIEDMT